MELRDRIAEIVSLDRGFKTSIETADAILAIPEIAEALALRGDLKAVAQQISGRIHNA